MMGITSANYPDMLSWFPPCSWSFLLLRSTYIDGNFWNHTLYIYIYLYYNVVCVQGKLFTMLKHILEFSLYVLKHVVFIFPPTFRQIYVVAAGNTELNAFARSLHWQFSLAQLQTLRSDNFGPPDRFTYNSALHGLEMKDVIRDDVGWLYEPRNLGFGRTWGEKVVFLGLLRL